MRVKVKRSMKKQKISLIFICLSSFVWGYSYADSPHFSDPKEDEILFKGQDAKSFFANRSQNKPQCIQKINTTIIDYLKIKAALQKTNYTKLELSRQLTKIQNIRTQLLSLFNECGPCTNRDIETKNTENQE